MIDPATISYQLLNEITHDKLKNAITAAFSLSTLPSNEELVLLSLAKMMDYLQSIEKYSREGPASGRNVEDHGANMLAWPNYLSMDTTKSHFCLFTLVAFDAVIRSLAGDETVHVPVGWSTIDRPQGAKIGAVSGNPVQSIVVRESEDTYGANL